MSYKALAAAMAVAAMGAQSALAIDFLEVEPNDSKAQANFIANMMAGDRIIGNSISSTGAGLDYFRVQTASDVLGIYRYRLVLTSQTVGHTGTIRGLNQIAATFGPWDGSSVGTPGTTDATAQTSSTTTTPARFNQWYGFGKQEEIYYRVTGGSTTTADYAATLEKVAVAPTHIGDFQAGLITISTIGQTTLDSDMWIYDQNFDAILGYGNDDESIHSGGTGATLQSSLPRMYNPGRYYMALSRFSMALNMGSPCDDDFRTGTLLDFPNAISSSASTTTATLMNFKVTDSTGDTFVTGTGFGPYDVHWYSFDVVPEPGTMAVLGFGLAALAMRRRRK